LYAIVLVGATELLELGIVTELLDQIGLGDLGLSGFGIDLPGFGSNTSVGEYAGEP